MSRFSKEWEGNRNGMKAVLKPQQPLKQRLDFAVRKIEIQAQSMDGAISRLKEKDRVLFSKVTDAYSRHDIQRANVYANELAEIRKMTSFMMGAKLALERVVLRLSTITQLGNAAVTLAPALKVLQSVRSGITGILPGAEQELGEIAGLLDEIMLESGQAPGAGFDFEAVSEDAQKILNEAAMVAEQKMKEKFPELPALKDSAENVGETSYKNA